MSVASTKADPSEGAPAAVPPAPKSSSSWFFIISPAERDVLALSTFIKVLIWPAYHSTDFEVHRNWLAITHTLPLRDWYFDTTSEWTLDYPPFFAYFSWILSLPASLADPLIASLHEGLNHAAWPTKVYMRSTVIVTELVLAGAVFALSRPARTDRKTVEEQGEAATRRTLAASLLMHPGLLIVDHIHFQYNGFLFGVLAWALWAAREGRPLLCAFLFASLLNLKHINMYLAPSFFVFLLRSYIIPPGTTLDTLPASFERLATLGTVTLLPFGLSLGPLLVDGMRHEQGPLGVVAQMVSRLFPFSRGLNHAYWAPNAWALWTAADRVLLKVFQRRPEVVQKLPSALSYKYSGLSAEALSSASRGLVGDTTFAVLPDVRPGACFGITIAFMLIYLVKLWRNPTYKSFLSSLILCGFTSFLFGWHVHEKAVLLVLVPMTLLASEDYAHFRTFVLANTAGTVALFPLLFTPAETPIKIGYMALWSILVFGAIAQRVYRPVPTNLSQAVHILETLYLAGFPLLQFYVSVVHPALFPTLSTASMASPAGAAAPSAALSASLGTPTAFASATPSHTLADSRTSADVGSADTFIAANMPTPAEVSAAAEASGEPLANVTSALAAASALPTSAGVPGLAESHTVPHAPGMSAGAGASLEFLPLMLVSVYCAIGVVWSFVRFSAIYLGRDFNEEQQSDSRSSAIRERATSIRQLGKGEKTM